MEQQGLDADDARRFLELARVAFELFTEPVDRDWHFRLQKISAVAADIGEVPSTHINHLTPRVLDIDVLYERMEARGITMIPRSSLSDWEGPDVLLRQTSFKALAEERQFRHADGTVRPGSLRVRFGEVEQRGVALTAAGRDRCDWMVAETDARPRLLQRSRPACWCRSPDRLRGFPAAVRRGHLPVEPDREEHPRRPGAGYAVRHRRTV